MQNQILRNSGWVVLLFLLTTLATQAQVKVGDSPTTLNSSAVLEMQSTSTKRGMLLPRVELLTTTDWGLNGPVGNKVNGMVVYNTKSDIVGSATYPAAGVGTYTFDGTGWVFSDVPKGGIEGQVLSKTASGLAWGTPASGVVRYTIGSTSGAGAIVKATGTGVTMSVNTATQTVTFSIPADVELISIRMFDEAATAFVSSYGLSSGANILNIRYSFSSGTTSYGNTILPQLQTVLDGAIPKWMDAVGNATNARKYVLESAPTGGSFTVKVPLMDPASLGNKWTILMNF